MVQSLLKTKHIPKDLETFIEKKTQGNPFYLEEIINSLIESSVLIKESGHQKNQGQQWQLVRKITELDISSSIHGVIAARVDRLEADSRRILQEASVIGRSFYYEIINKISETKKEINTCLETLEDLDLIKSLTSEQQGKKEIKTDLEYIFKHALTQEVVYNGLLKAQRKVIHEKIGTVIEHIFHDRLPEFYETLAHHFVKGSSTLKAVDYLIKSGDKSIKRYSLDESHDYFQQAFDLIDNMPDKSVQTSEITIDLLNRWAFVYYYSGDYKNLDKLFSSKKHLIELINDQNLTGMFYAWQGNILWETAHIVKAKECLIKAIDIATKINNKKIIGYAASWLSWVCAEMGSFKEGIEYGQIANKIGENFKQEHFIYFKSLAAIGYNFYWMGHASECLKIGEKLLQYGNQHSQIRSFTMGYFIKGCGYLNYGDFKNSVSSLEQLVKISVDPFYTMAFQLLLPVSYVISGDIDLAVDVNNKLLQFYKKNGINIMYDGAMGINGILLIEQGKMSQGLKIIKKIEQRYSRQQKRGVLPLYRLMLGKIYLEIIQKTKPISILTMLKNIGFIIQNVPTAFKKAIYWYSKTIEIAEELGAIGIKAQALLDLGIIYRIKKQNQKAKEHLEKAIEIFEEVGAYTFLKQAKKEFNQLTQ